jgi:hypothetical protein
MNHHQALLFTISKTNFAAWVMHFLMMSGGGAVVGALRYKPEGRGIDSRWCYWIFFFDIILLAALWPWGYFLGVKAAGAWG